MEKAMRYVASGVALCLMMFASGCPSVPSASFQSVENEPGTFTTDFIGNGGDVSQAFSWSNSGVRAEYSMDITTGWAGRVDVTITDADQTEVASFFLNSTSPDDSLNSTSMEGTPGTWTINVTIQDFAGDGSLHVGSAGAGS